MSTELRAVRKYFIDRGKAMSLIEHIDAFNVANIANTVIDKMFHVEILVGRGIKQNQDDVEIEQPVVVRLFTKGYSKMNEALDKSIEQAQRYIKKTLHAPTRLTGDLKNVKLDTITYEPVADSNDNIVVARLEFTALVILTTEL